MKQLTLTGDDNRSNLSHLAPKISKSKSIASLTEQSLRANKTLLPQKVGKRIKIHFPKMAAAMAKSSAMMFLKVCTSLSLLSTARCTS